MFFGFLWHGRIIPIQAIGYTDGGRLNIGTSTMALCEGLYGTYRSYRDPARKKINRPHVVESSEALTCSVRQRSQDLLRRQAIGTYQGMGFTLMCVKLRLGMECTVTS